MCIRDRDSLPLVIKKTFFLKEGPASIKADYDVSLPLPLLFSVEFNFNLMAKEDPKRYLLIEKRRFSPGEIAEVKEVEEVLVVDEVVGWQIRIGLNRPMTLWLFPIETVSLSEEGAERSYQGTSIVFITPIKGEKRISLTLVISQG